VSTQQIAMPFARRTWWLVDRDDPRALEVVDGTGAFVGAGPHYSRQTPGAAEFMSSGKTLVLLSECNRAVWGVIENRDPPGNLHWRCSMFRNLGAGLSSMLIREATNLTFSFWERRYGRLPGVPLRTEVDPRKTKRKRDPGRCFIRAGWIRVGESRGLVILQAPGEEARLFERAVA
jgi:hypothetical protein